MKRLLFVMVSAILSGAAYCSNLGTKLLSSSNADIDQQSGQSLILEQAAPSDASADWHFSHSSHVSHGSHGSHGSHVSHSSHVSHFSAF